MGVLTSQQSLNLMHLFFPFAVARSFDPVPPPPLVRGREVHLFALQNVHAAFHCLLASHANQRSWGVFYSGQIRDSATTDADLQIHVCGVRFLPLQFWWNRSQTQFSCQPGVRIPEAPPCPFR